MKSEKICYKSADGQHHPMGNGQWASDRYLYVASIYGFHIIMIIGVAIAIFVL